MLSSKGCLSYLELNYSGVMLGLADGEGDEPWWLLPPPQSVVLIWEEVLEKLCPPTCIETLGVTGGYVGRRLPNWISAGESAASFMSQRHLGLENLFSYTNYLTVSEMSGFEASDVPTFLKSSQFLHAASTCHNKTPRQVSWFSDFVWLLYNLRTLFLLVVRHVTAKRCSKFHVAS
jgi:hypothetical protein